MVGLALCLSLSLTLPLSLSVCYCNTCLFAAHSGCIVSFTQTELQNWVLKLRLVFTHHASRPVSSCVVVYVVFVNASRTESSFCVKTPDYCR